jgi:hypothetical protein
MNMVVERLEALLEKLEILACENFRLACAHRQDLLLNRSLEIRRGVEAMESILERITELEDVRRETCQELADLLGLPFRPLPWKLDELAACLPEDIAFRLRERGARLKAKLLEANDLARRNAVLAHAGDKLARESMQVMTRLAVNRQRSPSAYGRGGLATVRSAVPVLNSTEWRG